MKVASSVLLLAAAGVQAHYTFPATITNGQLSGNWTTIRETINHDSLGPVVDVNSDQIRCYELNPGTGAPQIASVQAGSTVTFTVNNIVGHQGPLQFYLAKVPSGYTAATWAATGNVWFKIYQDGPAGLGTSSITWPSQGKTQVTVTLPSCLANGDYLLRVEHIALHAASTVGGAQFYLSCAQLTVTGGTGTLNTGTLVSFPGAYKPTDPGILFQLWWPIPTSYINPGPAPVQC